MAFAHLTLMSSYVEQTIYISRNIVTSSIKL